MASEHTMAEIILRGRSYLYGLEVRPVVREEFLKVLRCRTPLLGGKLYASAFEAKPLFFTCKSRSCPSCGYRMTRLWQREQWCALPDIPYKGIVMTIPKQLRPFFRENRRLLNDLPKLAALAIQNYAKAVSGLEIMVLAVPHTFGSDLKFHPHIHMLISAGGLRRSDLRWIAKFRLERSDIMAAWRSVVTYYLRLALRTGLIKSSRRSDRTALILDQQYKREWVVYISHIHSKAHFLRYSGRYIRRPPLAQYRIVDVNSDKVAFRYKHRREIGGQRYIRIAIAEMNLKTFMTRLSTHVPDRYVHAIRYFGLLSPILKSRLSAVIFDRIGQKPRPKPKRLNWRESIVREFGVDPLIDSRGNQMHWVYSFYPTKHKIA
jgi:Putative transposase/Transposase zinc-binding domain